MMMMTIMVLMMRMCTLQVRRPRLSRWETRSPSAKHRAAGPGRQLMGVQHRSLQPSPHQLCTRFARSQGRAPRGQTGPTKQARTIPGAGGPTGGFRRRPRRPPADPATGPRCASGLTAGGSSALGSFLDVRLRQTLAHGPWASAEGRSPARSPGLLGADPHHLPTGPHARSCFAPAFPTHLPGGAHSDPPKTNVPRRDSAPHPP